MEYHVRQIAIQPALSYSKTLQGSQSMQYLVFDYQLDHYVTLKAVIMLQSLIVVITLSRKDLKNPTYVVLSNPRLVDAVPSAYDQWSLQPLNCFSTDSQKSFDSSLQYAIEAFLLQN